MNQEKLTEINISQEQKKGGGKALPSRCCQDSREGKTPSMILLGKKMKNTHVPDYGDLEERWRLGRGLGVSFLRLCPGERLSPRWPLQETRSLLC